MPTWSVSLVWNGTDRIMHGLYVAPTGEAAKAYAFLDWKLPFASWGALVAEEV